MSNFKIVCGTNPKDEIILNLDKVCEIALDKEYLENTNCVRIGVADIGESWVFETDLQCLSELMYCLKFADSEVIFTSEFINKHNRLLNQIEDLKKEVEDL